MSIVRKSDFKEVIDEQTMIDACCSRYDGSYYKFRNFYYCYQYEADLMIISKARYATEIEVKTSLADWRADFKKGKHQEHKFIKYFYYAVPAELVDKAPPEIPEQYGILSVAHGSNGSLYATVKRDAQVLPHTKVPKRVIVSAFKSVYFRHSDLRHRFRDLLSSHRHVLAELRKHEDAQHAKA